MSGQLEVVGRERLEGLCRRGRVEARTELFLQRRGDRIGQRRGPARVEE
jgi:hypothetical protein